MIIEILKIIACLSITMALFYVKVSVIKYVHELQNILYWIKGENANLTI